MPVWPSRQRVTSPSKLCPSASPLVSMPCVSANASWGNAAGVSLELLLCTLSYNACCAVLSWAMVCCAVVCGVMMCCAMLCNDLSSCTAVHPVVHDMLDTPRLCCAAAACMESNRTTTAESSSPVRGQMGVRVGGWCYQRLAEVRAPQQATLHTWPAAAALGVQTYLPVAADTLHQLYTCSSNEKACTQQNNKHRCCLDIVWSGA